MFWFCRHYQLKEDEMMLASLDDLVAADKTLAEAALDRGVVLKLMFR